MSKLQDLSKVERPIMGEVIPLVVFRAFRHFSSDYVENIMGRGVNVVFMNGGRELGKEIGANLYQDDIHEYLGGVIQWVADAKVGVLEPVELSDSKLVVQLAECITCAGMDSPGTRTCHFEVGLMAGVVEAFVKSKVPAEQTKCGPDGCEITVRLK